MLEYIDSDLSRESMGKLEEPCKMYIVNEQALQVDRLVFYTFHPHPHLHHLSTTRELLFPCKVKKVGDKHKDIWDFSARNQRLIVQNGCNTHFPKRLFPSSTLRARRAAGSASFPRIRTPSYDDNSS